MSYRHELLVEAPPERVREVAHGEFGAVDDPGEGLRLTLASRTPEDLHLSLRVDAADGGTRIELTGERTWRIPYFHWFFAWPLRRADRDAIAQVAAGIAAAAEGREPPRAPRERFRSLAPPVRFDERQSSTIATAAAMVLVAGLGASLFSQNVDFIAEAFDVSNRAVGVASAVARAGLVVALVAAALADRIGRRRLLLWSVAGVCVASGLSGLAPTFEIFAAAQLVSRGFFNAALIIGTIVVIEEAPERARAYAVGMLTLAWGAGSALAVVLLPIGDLGTQAWRLAFFVNASLLVLLPGFARNLPETTRYTSLANRFAPRGRVAELFQAPYGRRFALTLAFVFLAQTFSAPSAQFTNRFLGDERGFSGLEIALFLGVVAGLPGLMGVLWGGRFSETLGRKRVGIGGTIGGTVATMVFFLNSGLVIWVAATVAAVLGSMAAVALRAFGPELFPTEVRGTANGGIIIAGLLGSATGLVVAGQLSDTMSLGTAVAWVGVGPLIAVLVFVPLLPEPRERDLDVVSPPMV